MRTAIIHPSRNKSFSRSSFRVCIFENSLFLDSRNSILDSRSSILASRNSNVSTFETRESSFEDRVETVNLHLTGTVIVLVCYSCKYLGRGSWQAKRAGKNGARKSEPAEKPLNFEFSAFVHEHSILIGLK